MNRSYHAARSGFPGNARLAGVRLVATLAMLLGMVMVGAQSADAQSSSNSFNYDENGLQWSISWDDSIWSEGGGASSADFALQANNSSVQFLVLSDLNESPAACLEGLVPSFEDGAGVTDAVDFEDDNGDPVAANTDAYAYQIRTVTVPAGGSDLQADTVHACYDLDGSSLLWVVALIPTDSGELGDVFDLYDNIEVAGDPVPLGLADIVSGARSGTPEPSPSRRSSRSPEASPSDEVTPKASPSRRSSRSPEASPSGSGTGADETAGTYTSPNFGYSLAWNPDDWTVDQDIEDAGGRDLLELNTSDANSDGQVTGILFVEGSDEWSDTADCVATLGTEFGQFDPDTADPVVDADGDPFVVNEDDRSLAAYINTATDTDTTLLLECRTVPDSDIIVAFSYATAVIDNFVEDVYPGIQDIADSLSTEGPDASSSPSRRASRSAEASPSDESTPEAGSGDVDADAGTYTSPNFGYSLEWNPDDWDVDQELPNSGGRDRLDLFGAGSPYIIYIEGSDEWTDPDDCVATLSGEVSDFNPDTADPVLDANGDPFAISGNDRSLAAYLNTSRSGDTIALFECRADPDSDVIVAFTFLSGDTNNFVDDVYPDFADVADSLTFEGSGSGDATPVASRRAETDTTPEASPSSRPSRSARPSPSDDATPEASRRGSTGDTGVNGDQYASPTYGYQLSWDGDVWTVEDESSEDDVDALTLSSDLLTLNVTGYNSGDGATDTCFNNVVTVVNDRGDGNAEILTGDDGNPIGASDDTDTSGQRFIAYSVDGNQFGSLVTCVSLDSENVLALEFTAVPDDLLSDDATTQISDIFDALSL